MHGVTATSGSLGWGVAGSNLGCRGRPGGAKPVGGGYPWVWGPSGHHRGLQHPQLCVPGPWCGWEQPAPAGQVCSCPGPWQVGCAAPPSLPPARKVAGRQVGRSGQWLLSQFARNVLAAPSFTLSLPAPTSPCSPGAAGTQPMPGTHLQPRLAWTSSPSPGSRPPLLPLCAPVTPAEPWPPRVPISLLPEHSKAGAVHLCDRQTRVGLRSGPGMSQDPNNSPQSGTRAQGREPQKEWAFLEEGAL